MNHLSILWSGMWRILLVLFVLVAIVCLTIWSPILMMIVVFLGLSYAVGHTARLDDDFPFRSPHQNDDK